MQGKRKMIGTVFGSERGAVALISVLALSMIMLALGLAMVFSKFAESDIVLNQNNSSMALYAAESGVRDAMQKVSRNKNYESAGYCLLLENKRADIIVTRLVGQTEIISQGINGVSDCTSAGTNKKRIKAVLNIASEGKVTIASWEEITN